MWPQAGLINGSDYNVQSLISYQILKEGILMLRLTEVRAGSDCDVLWMFGPFAQKLREEFHMDETRTLHIMRRWGSGHIIVKYGERVLAMTPEIAGKVMVSDC